MARAVCARFNNVLPIEHIYALVRSPRQLERVLEEIANAPGVVLHTIVDQSLRGALEAGCQKLDMPCIAALDPLVSALSRYLGAPLSTRVGAQYSLDTDYFNRMDALSYALGHDDGQGTPGPADAPTSSWSGVSRTSKTPTCIYLAHRGVRAANVPLVPPTEPPAALQDAQGRAGGRADRLAGPPGGDPPQPAAQPQRGARQQLCRHRRRCAERSSPPGGCSSARAGR